MLLRIPIHGISTTYVNGCRCKPCTRANTLRQRDKKVKPAMPFKHEVDCTCIRCEIRKDETKIRQDVLDGKKLPRFMTIRLVCPSCDKIFSLPRKHYSFRVMRNSDKEIYC